VLVALVSEIFVESVQKAAEAFGMSQAFVGFIVVALVGGAAEMASAFSGARKNRLDLSVGIALGSASQIALFVAPVLVLLSYVIGPSPMGLQFWPGAVAMMFIATLTASLVTNSGRSAWFVGVLVLMVYLKLTVMKTLLGTAAAAAALIVTQAQAQDTTVIEPIVTTNSAMPIVEEPEDEGWAFSLSGYQYFVPDDADYFQPTFTIDHKWLHLEARYNYEDLKTASLWAGYNFGGGNKLIWEFTPMVGGVFGNTAGIAPGYKGSLGWWKLELYSEGE
jgi:hypothetical protein